MKLLIDECIANSTRLVLESAGFEILKVEDVLESGIDDKAIFKYGADERIPIITMIGVLV